MRDVTHVVYNGKSYIVVSPYADIDESRLSIVDRLGLAYCRLCSHEWDALLGPEPEYKVDEAAYRKMDAIKELIGEANTSRCWWNFNLKRTEDEWRTWYSAKYSPKPLANRVNRSRQSGDCEEGRRKKLKYLPNFIRTLFAKE